jgi:hypothetical protein
MLADTVSSDWHLFQKYADDDDPSSWVRALELIRGRPFENLKCSDWPIMEGILHGIERVVGALAVRVSGYLMGRGNADAAIWAARQGLRACPYDERLYRSLLEAADHEGNSMAVESVMDELLFLVIARKALGSLCQRERRLEVIDSSVHPLTSSLYRRLSCRYHRPTQTDVNGPPIRL